MRACTRPICKQPRLVYKIYIKFIYLSLFICRKFLELTWCIDVKQRAGCLSYVDDPQGFLTILAQTLTLDKSNIWSVKPDYIQLFAKDDKIRNFVKHYLNKETNDNICADCLIISKKRKGVKNEAFLNRNCTCRR